MIGKIVGKEEAIENLNRNIDYAIEINNWKNDAGFCRETGTSKATLSSIRKKERMPIIYPFFEQVCNVTGFRLDEFINKDLRAEAEKSGEGAETERELDYYKCFGVYTVYYFSTTSLKGREHKSDAESLRYGVLLLCRNPNGSYECIADLDLTAKQQAERYYSCFDCDDKEKLIRHKNFRREYVNRYYQKLYIGTFKINERSILLQFESTQDSATMLLNKYPGTSAVYHGGLAATVSLSKGMESVPVMQVSGIARGLITDPAEVIASKLKLSYPSIKCRDEDEIELLDMIDAVTMRYNSEQGENHNPAFIMKNQGRILLHGAMNMAIDKTVERNMARSFRINTMNDNDWYHYALLFEEA